LLVETLYWGASGLPVLLLLLAVLGFLMGSYSILSGLFGVAYANVPKFLALCGATTFFVGFGIFVALRQTGGAEALIEGLRMAEWNEGRRLFQFEVPLLSLPVQLLFVPLTLLIRPDVIQFPLAARSTRGAVVGVILGVAVVMGLYALLILLGVALSGLFALDPSALYAGDAIDDPGMILPMLMANYFPIGCRGIWLVAVLAAWISTIPFLWTAITTMIARDLLGRTDPDDGKEPRSPWVARGVSLLVVFATMVVAIGFAIVLEHSPVGYLLRSIAFAILAGPFLAIVLCARLWPGANSVGALAALAAGAFAAVSLSVWDHFDWGNTFQPDWATTILASFAITVVVLVVVSLCTWRPVKPTPR
jgi:Na+/proline symporter